MAGYGWDEYDVRSGGQQTIHDAGNRIDITTSFVKIPGGNNGGSWAVRVKGVPRADAPPDLKTTAVFYASLQGLGSLEVANGFESLGYDGDVILKGAQALASQRKYNEAIFNLIAVPDVCRECYDKSMDLSAEIYKQYEDYTCGQNLAAAKAAWANLDSDKAAESLGLINPEAKCYAEAQQLADQIQKKLLEDGKVWDFKVKKYDDATSMEKQKLQNIHDIGVAAASNYSYAKWDWLYK